jgi:lipopolysaccharide export system permease protein
VIIFRYLFKEVYSVLSAITFILLFLLLSNQFAVFLGRAVGGFLSLSAVLELIMLEIPILLAYLLPLGFYFAVLLSYSKLYADSEMTVLFACGVSRAKLSLITLYLAGGLALIVLGITCFANPWIVGKQRDVLAKALASASLEKITPGRFQSFDKGQWTFYTEKVSRNHSQAEKIFVAQEINDPRAPEGLTWRIMTAKSGMQREEQPGGKKILFFQDGHQYSGIPGEKKFQIVSFEKLGLFLPEPSWSKSNTELAKSTLALWQERKTNLKGAGELQLRFSLPLSIILLGLMAVPLSQVSPRQGRFGRFLPAILLYVAYANLIFIAQNSVKQGSWSPILGVWPVHLGFLILLLVLTIHQIGWVHTKRILKSTPVFFGKRASVGG